MSAIWSSEAQRQCTVCDGFGSVDSSERVVDWSKPELGRVRDEANPQLARCPACKGTGYDPPDPPKLGGCGELLSH